jgi:hypothetical protein
MSKFTDAQKNALNVLQEKGSWMSHWQLWNDGINTSSVIALVKKGLAEETIVDCVNGYSFKAWRAKEQ